MLAALGSAEPAGFIILQRGPWSAAAATRAAQLSLAVLLGQHAAPEPAGRMELPVVVVTCGSMVAVSFLLCKRGKISIPPKHGKFPPFSGGVLTL